MQSPTHDPGSALAIRSQYRQAQSRAARLRLLVDTGQELTQLPPAAMRQRALQRACAFMAMDHGLLLEWHAAQPPQATAQHGGSERLAALHELAKSATLHPEWLPQTDTALPQVLRIPLPGADGQAFGALLLANSVALAAPDSEDLESLQLLATLLAAHLENQRLLQALQARERTMSELVHRLFSAQEDERKRVAYDLHDGLAQTLAGLHQRLQGFAGRCPTLPQELHNELQSILTLAQGCVGEGRQLIGGLRPNVLDDFGLYKAIDKEADRLRDAGLEVHWRQQSSARLPGASEIALFRIAQEGINNILKHARASRAELSLQLADGQAALALADNGVGFALDSPLSSCGGQHLGLAAMQERASLLGGELSWHSAPGHGTRLLARVPLPTAGEQP
ncbi:Histidine kinase-, DNA gyrase B-, and HSP90-like ATPase [Pseudomonas sp. NFIX51]|uniref:sensor histidine kinase n=1 Tax=unclassified Pseudomonas TaxID=196821 RepID=UPI0008B379F2|nr:MULTISPECIES: sensor histidine kinase [unclassified Pseudomonas]SEK87278.1 Histidine kinase [Pseudomonas sp. NFACC41-3]SMH43167.1 Histidine kinase-, DNA gyrase B-, and HSP90-like ATPase [Pseudomonas sp. NFIX51]